MPQIQEQYRDSTSLDIEYKAAPTCREFHLSDAFVRALIGPIGSGKSVACCIEILKKSIEQEEFNGYRRSRWAIIRNTYRELIDTTMRTWFDWVPESMGHMKKQDMEFIMSFVLPDGTIVYSQILFRALDRPNDIKKLLSLELTGGWINEVREIPKQVLDMLVGRVGRYPAKRQGGPSWWGVIMDTNPPDEDHWFHKMFEEELPENCSIHHQPSGLSENAENVENLPDNYYPNMMAGKDEEWIKVYVHGQYGYISDGLPVYPEFKPHIHVADTPIDYNERVELEIGVDFGRSPSAVFGQEIDGQMRIIDELVTEGISATMFASLLSQRIRGHYRGASLRVTGDPAGDNLGEQVDESCIDILRAAGIPIDPADTNNFTLRRNAVVSPLTSLNVEGQPQLVISPKCTALRKAMSGGYMYKRVQTSGEVFQNKPDKNSHSHVAEALQYLCVGAGYADDLLTGSNSALDHKVLGALNAAERQQIQRDMPAFMRST